MNSCTCKKVLIKLQVGIILFKLTGHQSSKNKENHNLKGDLDTQTQILVSLCLHVLLSFCFDWEDISNTQDSVSLAIQTPQNFSKILPACHIFNSRLGVSTSQWNTISCVWYITLKMVQHVNNLAAIYQIILACHATYTYSGTLTFRALENQVAWEIRNQIPIRPGCKTCMKRITHENQLTRLPL